MWNAQNFPFLTQLLFYQNGTEYDQLSILNPDYTLNYDKLEQQVRAVALVVRECTEAAGTPGSPVVRRVAAAVQDQSYYVHWR